jgi:hypothetical protein
MSEHNVELREWDSFYLIVGGAAGALIGLQFVVMTLIAERPSPASAEAGGVFATPTVVHFGTTLLLSAMMCAPWHGAVVPAMLWGIVGSCGFVYALVVIQRMRKQTAYRPRLDDWCFYAVIPIMAYATLGLSAFIAASCERVSLFAGAGAGATLAFSSLASVTRGTPWPITCL